MNLDGLLNDSDLGSISDLSSDTSAILNEASDPLNFKHAVFQNGPRTVTASLEGQRKVTAKRDARARGHAQRT